MEQNLIISAHKFCTNNREYLQKDKKCGCFYCLKIFDHAEIENWVLDPPIGTAICPYCFIDSVIGESSGLPITTEFLTELNKYWF